MTIVWGIFLALLLARLNNRHSPFRIQRVHFSPDDQFKRIGVYYMCIDDLPL